MRMRIPMARACLVKERARAAKKRRCGQGHFVWHIHATDGTLRAVLGGAGIAGWPERPAVGTVTGGTTSVRLSRSVLMTLRADIRLNALMSPVRWAATQVESGGTRFTSMGRQPGQSHRRIPAYQPRQLALQRVFPYLVVLEPKRRMEVTNRRPCISPRTEKLT